jgi:hypothetical protein
VISEKDQIVPTTASTITTARLKVLRWIQEPNRNPRFLRSHVDADASADEAIVERFLSWVQPAGFTLTPINDGTEKEPKWAGHWLYRGNQFVGFKQPDYVENRIDSLLLACAALLENEWCRSRL